MVQRIDRLKKNKIHFIINIILILLIFIINLNFCFAGNLGDAFGDNLEQAAGTQGAGYDTGIEADAVIGEIINVVLSFLGVIFMVLMIYGGYIWMVARGNEQEVEKAKNIIIAATIGLIIVISAYAISWFIINQFGGAVLK